MAHWQVTLPVGRGCGTQPPAHTASVPFKFNCKLKLARDSRGARESNFEVAGGGILVLRASGAGGGLGGSGSFKLLNDNTHHHDTTSSTTSSTVTVYS